MASGSRRPWASALVVLALATGCAPGSPSPSPSTRTAAATGADATSAGATAVAPGVAPGTGSLVIVGRIVTMDDPADVEALIIKDGTVAAVGTRDRVLTQAGDGVRVIDLGEDVAYPGFIDAHAHWIGDRDIHGLDRPAPAIDGARSRGWTSISEQWVNPERLAELEALARDDALPLRVDAYLALNFGHEFLGDWYATREPGPVDDHLRVRGVKIHLDDGSGNVVNRQPADLTAAIARAAGATSWTLGCTSPPRATRRGPSRISCQATGASS